MGSYADLSSTIQDIIIAAIDSDMECHDWHGSYWHGYTHTMPGGGRVPAVDIHIDNCGNLTFPHNRRTAHLSLETLDWNPVTQCYNHWFQAIPQLFVGWDSLPDPGKYTGPVATLKSGTHALFQFASVEPGGTTIGGNGATGDIGYLNDELTKFDGAAMRAFHRFYAAQLPNVTSGQAALAHALYFGMVAEKEVWQRSQVDVADIATKAVQAMKNAHPTAPQEGWGAFFTVIGAIAAAATIVITDGAAAAFVGGASTVIGIVGGMVHDPDAQQRQQVPLGAATPQGVFSNMTKALTQLNKEICSQEGKIIDAASQSVNEAYDNPASFNLIDAAKAQIKRAHVSAPNVLDDDNVAELRVHTGVLKEIATSVLTGIGANYDTARSIIARADDVSLWERPAGIGLDSTYSVWAELEWHLEEVLKDTAWEVDAVAHHLSLVVKDLSQTDAQVRSALVHDTQRVQHGSGAYTGRPQPEYTPHGGPMRAI